MTGQHSTPDGGHLTLVRMPPMTDSTRRTRQAVEEIGAHSTNVLAVLYSESPDDWLSTWRGGVTPADVGVVTVGENRSAATAAAGTDVSSLMPVKVVDEPGDLTGVGMRISEYFSRWDASPNTLVFSFDSLTTLLQYSELKRTFRFLHILTDNLRQRDAVGFFHIDPSAHDERTFRTIEHLFDRVVQVDDDPRTTV